MYRDASRVVEQLLKQEQRHVKGQKRNRQGEPGAQGLKALALADGVKNKSKTYAVVCETLKFKDSIDQVIAHAKVSRGSLAKNEGLLYVMLYDHLFGKGIKGGGAVKRAILAKDKELRAALKHVMKKRGASLTEDLLPDHVRNAPALPRFARVNMIKSTAKRVIGSLDPELSASVKRDSHISYLLRFPPKTDLHAHPLVQEGALILQDKSSCLPAHVLAQALERHRVKPSKTDAIDATAAPGNKTSQLAALGIRRVLAFDKDERRLAILERRMKEAGALAGHGGAVTPACRDFLQVSPDEADLERVRVILLDPSCSGSGMVGRVDHLVQGSEAPAKRRKQAGGEPAADGPSSGDRLERLARFQLECLNHALSFPQVDFVSYSTCSVHAVENERVVAEALASHPEFTLEDALQSWKRRGVENEGLAPELARLVLRADPVLDDTGGFFVALFVRRSRVQATTEAAQPTASESGDVDEATARRRAKLRERRKRRKCRQVDAASASAEGVGSIATSSNDAADGDDEAGGDGVTAKATAVSS